MKYTCISFFFSLLLLCSYIHTWIKSVRRAARRRQHGNNARDPLSVIQFHSWAVSLETGSLYVFSFYFTFQSFVYLSFIDKKPAKTKFNFSRSKNSGESGVQSAFQKSRIQFQIQKKYSCNILIHNSLFFFVMPFTCVQNTEWKEQNYEIATKSR